MSSAPSRRRFDARPWLPLVLLLAGCGGGGGGGGSSSPKITAPKGGSYWAGTKQIKWKTFDNDEKVTVEVSDDGGATWTALETGGKDDGKYNWDTTSVADGGQYRVRVRAGGEKATSGVFTVDNTAPVLVLSAPLGGELWGGVREVTWVTTDDNPGTVAILLSSDGGATYPTVVAAAAPDVDLYSWATSGQPDGTQYRLQLTATDLAGNAGVAVASTSNFELDNTVPLVSLTSPVGGESWGALQQVTWTTTDLHPSTVDLLLSTDSGATFTETIATDVPDTGSYDWQTGEAPDGTTLRVRVVATDGAGNDSDPSDSAADFTIRNVRILGDAHYQDVNGNSVIDAGDQLYLLFDKNIDVSGSAGPSDLALAVAGDTLGAGATVTDGAENNSVLVTLGANPVLTARGPFDEDELTAGSSSAIDISPTMSADAIEETGTGTDAVPSGMKDVTPGFVALAPLGAGVDLPRRAALGDLDADGDPDLVVGITGGAADIVYLGDGAGGWTPSQSLGTDDTRDVALGDVDRDGDLDLVTAVVGANRVWLNDGAGAFTDSGQALGANDSQAVVLVDVDCDGDLDACFGNAASQGLRVWLNDGAGVFSDSLQSLGSASTVALAAGDLDGDGDVDLFAANSGSPSRVWRNAGGVFSAGGTTPTTNAQDVALGDLDGDGDLDVVIAVLGQNEVRLNSGTGTFPGAARFLGNNDNRAALLLDLESDGDLDIWTVKNVDGGRFWINDGAASFVEDTVRTLSSAALDGVVGRVDGDDDLDLVVINDLNAHRTYRSSRSGGQPLATLQDSGAAFGPWDSGDPAVGDVDGDGRVDLVVPAIAGTHHVLHGDGTGAFAEGVEFGTGDAQGGTLFDADCDGDLDYLQRLTGAGDRLWTNDGSGVFTDSGQSIGGTAFLVGDLDGDGDPDLAVAPSGAGVEIWDNDGLGEFTATGDSFAPISSAYVLPGDLDGDGDLDLWCGGGASDQAWENDGAGVFTSAATLVNGVLSASALLADFDGDSDLDVLRSTDSGGVLPARNDGSFTLTVLASSGPASVFTRLEALDRDEDGDLDLFATDTLNTTWSVLIGNGAGNFGSVAQSAILAGTVSFRRIDADGDGDADLYAARGNGVATDDLLLIMD